MRRTNQKNVSLIPIAVKAPHRGAARSRYAYGLSSPETFTYKLHPFPDGSSLTRLSDKPKVSPSPSPSLG